MDFDIDKKLNELRDASRESNSMMVKGAVGFIIMAVIDVCVDVFVPTDAWWWTILRTVLAVITGVPLFVAGYELAWRQHDIRSDQADAAGWSYLSYRLRYSAKRRLNQSLLFAAVLVLLAIITSYTLFYTLGAGIIIAGCLGIAAYCRLTPDEKVLREQDVPDPRDVLDAVDEESAKMDQQARRELRREEINKRKKRMREEAKDDGSDDDIDYDDEDYDDEDDSPKHRKKHGILSQLF